MGYAKSGSWTLLSGWVIFNGMNVCRVAMECHSERESRWVTASPAMLEALKDALAATRTVGGEA